MLGLLVNLGFASFSLNDLARTQSSFLELFLGPFTTAIYRKKDKSKECVDDIARKTNKELSILLTAKNVLI